MNFTAPIFSRVVRTAPKDRDDAAIGAAMRVLGNKLDIAENQVSRHAFLAGDELTDWRNAPAFTPEIKEALIATGFLRQAADVTYATDNFAAGEAIGKWAKGTFEKQGKQAKIAMLDLSPEQVSVDVQRDQGFLKGFGINTGNVNRIGDEKDPRIVGHDVTDGAEEGGRTAMENLLQKDPNINLVYTINEPAAAGAYEALKAAGKQKGVTIVSVDGGCPGVQNVKKGIIGATSQQYPLKMADDGVKAVVAFAKDGKKPQMPAGKSFINTGVTLITDDAAAGVPSKDTKFGLANCWG